MKPCQLFGSVSMSSYLQLNSELEKRKNMNIQKNFRALNFAVWLRFCFADKNISKCCLKLESVQLEHVCDRSKLMQLSVCKCVSVSYWWEHMEEKRDALLRCRSYTLSHRYLSPTCLAMSSGLKQSSAKLRIVLACFISGVYHIPPWNTTAGKRYCQGSQKTIEQALMIYMYISAIMPTQTEVTESGIWWHQWCCLR